MFIGSPQAQDGSHASTRNHNILRRQQNSAGMSGKTEAVIVVAVVLGVILCLGLFGILLLRYLRVRYDEPTYLPGTYLKDKWRTWLPKSEKKKRYSSSLQRRSATPGQMSSSQLDLSNSQPAAGSAPDRHTSVRSTITLPSYTATARANESVMGRAGERAGDTIVEYPEDEQEVEQRRDEEMESLFQIRQARRDERIAREERARLRREAQEAGDEETLRALRDLAAAPRNADDPTGQRSVDALIREHKARNRGPRTAAVQYAEVGVARLDGSRVRADSAASDNAPLLDAAAGMGSGGRPRAGTGDSSRSRSRTPGRRFFGHIRNISQSSLRITSNDMSDDEGSIDELTPQPSRAPSGMSELEMNDPMIPRTLSGRVVEPPQYTNIEMTSPDLREPESAATRNTPHAAPGETPPSYPWLPTLGPLPSIEITTFDMPTHGSS